MQEGVLLNVLYVICVIYYVKRYVIKTLGKRELVTMNNQMTILGIDPKFGMSILAILITDFNEF